MAALVALSLSSAQSQAPSTVTVNGFAYDSLRAAPLAGAFVGIAGTSLSAVTDSRGRFRFDVAPGRYTFMMHHDVLDSIGFTGRSIRALIERANQTITLTVPSFATLWRAACGTATPPKDSGLVYGFVRSADGERPIPGARVGVVWMDISYEKKAGFGQQQWGAEVSVDATGQYALCGVTQSVALHLIAASDSLISGRVELQPLKLRVARRDFLLAPAALAAGDSLSARGTVVGSLTGDGGRAVSGAIVNIEGLPEVRSDENGRFVLRDVPAGTRQIEVRAIGATPLVTIVDVTPLDTTTVALSLSKVVTLEEVTVKARRFRDVMVRDIAERRQVGLGYHRDSTDIARLPSVTTIFDGIAGLRVQRGVGSRFSITNADGARLCVWIDRVLLDFVDLYLLTPDAIAAVEVYPRGFTTPEEFRPRRRSAGCTGAIVVWTKRYLQ
jgi:carboxypeptidase family protein